MAEATACGAVGGMPSLCPLPSSSSSGRGHCLATDACGRGHLEGCPSSSLQADCASSTSSSSDATRGSPLDGFDLASNSVASAQTAVNFEGAEPQDGSPPAAHFGPEVSSATDGGLYSRRCAESHFNVPGSGASTLRANSIWESLHRHVFASSSHFGHFFRSLATKASKPHVGATTASVFPMPLPFPEVYIKKRTSCPHTSFMKLINLQIGALNWLYLHQPYEPPSTICGHKCLSAVQQSVVDRFWKLGKAWHEHPAIPASDMGRTAAKQESFEDTLAKLSSFAEKSLQNHGQYKKNQRPRCHSMPSGKVGSVVGKMTKGDLSGAQPIVASRIKMEGSPTFDPSPFLDAETKDLYIHPLEHAIEPEPSTVPPRVQVHASFEEKLRLLKLLEKTDRLAFRRISDVPKGYGNGLFSVPKNLHVDRLILDARPANLLQNASNKFIMSMASSCTLLGLHLEPWEKLLMSGDDLSNFFYCFSVTEQRVTKNFLEWKVPVSAVRGMKSFPSELQGENYVYACLATLAMGDAAACSFAQTSHIAMGIQSGAFDRCNLVTLHGRIPRDPFAAGVIIDDLVFLEKVGWEVAKGPRSTASRAAMHDIYSKVGLDPHPEKGFAHKTIANFWGSQVDGEIGLVRANICRSLSLCWIADRVASLGVASIGLLEALAGGFVSIFSYRRRMMSLLDSVYRVQAGRSQKDIIKLPQCLVDELYIASALLPLAVTDIRASFCEALYAVDASDWGEAVVKAHVGKHLGKELHRHSLQKSVWTKLLSPFKSWQKTHELLDPCDELPGEFDEYVEHPLWETASRGLQFELVCKSRARRRRHINLGELKAYLDAERDAGLTQGDIRVPILGDSQVCLGAIVKGRSASPGLNRLLKSSLCHHLGLGIYSSGAYVRSCYNSADDPTRGQAIRRPDIILPGWWEDACAGNFGPLDVFLEECNMHPFQLDGVPSLKELNLQDPCVVGNVPKSKARKLRERVRAKLRLRKVTAPIEDKHVHPSKSREFPWDCECDRDLLSFSEDLFVFAKGITWPPEQPGFLDLFSGNMGFARAAINMGAPWVLTLDWNDGPHCDLLKADLRSKLERMLRGGVFIHLSAAPVCASFSRAITPAIRNHIYPKGVPGMGPITFNKLQEGNSHLSWICSLIRICILKGIHYWLENPDSSHMWYQPEILTLPNNACQRFYRVDFCAFKTPWRKRSRFLTSGRLANTKKLCTRDHRHIVLRGRSSRHGKCWTKVAQAYPTGLCAMLAWSACADTGLLRNRHVTIGEVAKCCGNRIGEASHPGPRRPTAADFRCQNPLSSVELIRPEPQLSG